MLTLQRLAVKYQEISEISMLKKDWRKFGQQLRQYPNRTR